MRRYIRAFLVCMLFAVFSALYVYSKLFYSDLSVGGGLGGKTFLHRAAASQRSDIGQETRRGPDETGPGDQHWYTRYETWKLGERRGMTDQELFGWQEKSTSKPSSRYIMRNAEGSARTAAAMHLAVVACGQRLEETLTMLKSAVMLSIKPLCLHIFAEDQLHASFLEALESWPSSFRCRFNYTLYPITFPHENAGEWKKLFKPCASQRLFLPLILKEVDSLVYVDSDILFLQPVDALWSLLAHFNATQLAAMAPEHEEPRIAWYSRFARHPYYGRTGINSGVMLMNMTRIRATYFKNDMTSVGLRWEELLMPLLQKYKLNMTWGDQDLLNIIFHHNPECLLEVPCHWNYRPDHCIYGSNCGSAEEEGVFILHGNRGVYHDLKQPAFRAVYDAIRQYSFREDLVSSLLVPLEEELMKTTRSYCGKSHVLFTKRLAHSLANVNRDAQRPHGR
ncbi:glucoside xylosyltransferase 1 isoform X1 [Salvelinus alpinus]|uniref:glucoside xylosyltransferase 1 isoform X1 n=1 Tax=Salvelinus alpinus TaxID=8036 RepID=UPI0039FD3B25